LTKIHRHDFLLSSFAFVFFTFITFRKQQYLLASKFAKWVQPVTCCNEQLKQIQSETHISTSVFVGRQNACGKLNIEKSLRKSWLFIQTHKQFLQIQLKCEREHLKWSEQHQSLCPSYEVEYKLRWRLVHHQPEIIWASCVWPSKACKAKPLFLVILKTKLSSPSCHIDELHRLAIYLLIKVN
jgi:hypothetical protein